MQPRSASSSEVTPSDWVDLPNVDPPEASTPPSEASQDNPQAAPALRRSGRVSIPPDRYTPGIP